MKIGPYVEKLNSSKQYKEFKQKYPDSFIAAGFFILDLDMGQNIHQIDFFIPSQKKFAAFSLDDKIKFQVLESVTDKKPEKLDIKTNTDLDELKGILQDEMKNKSMTEDIKKIIAVLQNIQGKKVWNLNCVLSGMEILKAHIDDESKTILRMEKVSLMDIMKKIPVQGLQGMSPPNQKLNPKQVKIEMKKLNELEEEIQKEKSELQKKASKKQGKIKA